MTVTDTPPAGPSAGRPATGSSPGASGRRRGPGRLDPFGMVPALVVLIAVGLTLPPVTGVLLGSAWMVPVLVCTAVALLPVALLRVVRAPEGVLTVAGAVVLVAAVSAVYFPTTTLLGVVPTTGTLTAAADALTATSDLIRTSVIPVEADTGTLMLFSVAAGLIALVVEALVFSLRMPALGGVPLLALLLVPALMRPDSIGVLGFAGAAVGYLLVLAAGHAWALRRSPEGSSATVSSATAADAVVGGDGPSRHTDTLDSAPAGWVSTAILGVVVLVASLAVPAAIPGFTSGLFPHGSRLRLVEPDDRVSPLIRLGDDLKAPQAGRGEVRYSTTADNPVYLRMSTITDLEGSQWGPDQDTRAYESLRNTLTDGPAPSGRTDYARVQTTGYSMPWLPLPQNARYVSTDDARWLVNPRTGDVRTVDGHGYPSAEYATQLITPELTRQGLLASPNRVPASMASTLQLPNQMPAVIRETADRLAATSPDHFARALAIQQFLRGGSFTYSLDAPGRNGYDGTGIRIVGEFLTQREGYCVHFASTMAVLARAMGIPSRIVVGLAPGRVAESPVGDTSRAPRGQQWQTFSSDSRDAHAWPELWFEDDGWVPFEPTPGRGVLPGYTVTPGGGASAAPDTSGEDPRQQSGAAPAAAPESASATTAPDAATTQATRTSSPWLAGLVTGVVLLIALLLVPALLRVTRRRRRLDAVRDADSGTAALTAWREVVDTAVDVGRGPGAHETPRAFLARLGGSSPLPAPAADRLVAAVERARYGRPVPAGAGPSRPPEPEQDDGRVRAADVEALRAALLRPLPRTARWGAALAPRSLLTRLRDRGDG
ncbi:DUF3488 and transglutaminase-like domain-containing protein [Tersicoccus sp. Bi-70]|uniref:transglutaminase TgpA family protein n=1 Tax=Tersicoccus sp. Bi-70 TaxID=1897634 RepID=UPI000976E584|nr:DUF3488 and transglutaminase-like domain-containing protein [Tersicoccus sp. Bi-70]OMH31394.1 hypothetical protein BGP79_10295 [Tersicoccus sp. Bi-70]